ncbi:MAG TPA: hypothetical protein VFU55_09625 [Terracidiphilus sp.]|nr:hypothetical protein [Terracidiphilus sp.]
MKRRFLAPSRFLSRAALLLASPALAIAVASAAAQPSPAASAAYNAYLRSVELRLARQHRSQANFLANLVPGSPRDRDLHRGAPLLEDLSPGSSAISGALIHHWRATAFIPGATAAEFDRLLRDFPAYPRIFAPQVQRVWVLNGSTNGARITMRMLQHHGITVVLDGTFRVTFGRLDALHAFSNSASTAISEVASAGSARGHRLAPAADHGFLWRMNTFWSAEQRNGGLYLQIESVSLTRSIPFGLAWAVRPFTQSIPRDSLAFTLNAARRALQPPHHAAAASAMPSRRTERNPS